MTDTVERFSNRVANYVKYRPGYPRAIIGYLEQTCGFTHESVVADIGCGTGLSSQLFLENCKRVIGVEPNAAMRAAAIEFLADFPDFSIIDGTSEATTLPDHSVDIVVAAQAFHWFDPERTRAEFRRILKPGGHVVLIWNERQLRTLLEDYVDHYNSHRPHRGIQQRAPNDTGDVIPIGKDQPIQRHTTCAGLINQYRTAA